MEKMEGVVLQADTSAEEYKNQGNEEFKQGNYEKAVYFYTQALGNLNKLYSLIYRLI